MIEVIYDKNNIKIYSFHIDIPGIPSNLLYSYNDHQDQDIDEIDPF